MFGHRRPPQRPRWKARSGVLLCHVMRRTDVLEIRLEPALRDSHKTPLSSCPQSASVPAPRPETPENRRTPYVGP